MLAQGDLSTTQNRSFETFSREVSNRILKNPETALARLWIRLSAAAQTVLVRHLGYYIGRWSDERAFDVRNQRLAPRIRDARQRIKMFTKALENCLRVEEDPNRGTILITADASGYDQHFPLRQILVAQILCWKKVLADCKHAGNRKRFGISRNGIWLIFAQEFVRDWSQRHLDEEVKLRPAEIAALIDTLLAVDGVENLDPTDRELIWKTIRHFRKNQLNTVFLSELKKNPQAYVF